MEIKVTDILQLTLLQREHATTLLQMVIDNKDHLRPWLAFADHLNSLAVAQQFIEGTIKRKEAKEEYAFLIYHNLEAVGRIGVYKIDPSHSSAEIGYWIISNQEGKGIITMACKALLQFCFETLQLHRIEIRCGTLNHKSYAVAEKLGFTREGLLRDCERLNNQYVDHYIYALLKHEYEKGSDAYILPHSIP